MTVAWAAPGTVRAVCVTGMHRSGTSFATSALHHLGVSLGDEAGLLPPGPDNPAGYFENKAIQELDDELLAHLGGAWDRPPRLAPGWEDGDELDAFRARAVAILDTNFAAAAAAGRLIGFKDPRVSLLLPFWRTVLPVTHTIVLVRDPTEVWASLAARNELGPATSAALWLRYLLAATANDPDHLIVAQNDFYDDLAVTLARIAAHLELDPPTDAVVAAVAGDLDPRLRHHHASAGNVDPDAPTADPLVAMAAAVWNGGAIDLDALGPGVATALGEGWLQPAGAEDELARARAEAVSFKEQLKRRNAVVKALKEGRPPPEPLPETPVVSLESDR